MGFAADDVRLIIVIAVLAVVFGGAFVVIWGLYLIGIIIVISIIAVAFILQSLSKLNRDRRGEQKPS